MNETKTNSLCSIVIDNNKEKDEKSEFSSFEAMSHIVAFAFVVYIVWLAVPGSSLFSWHPTLMTIGFSFLMLEAILVFSKSSSLVPSKTRATKARYHWVLQVLAVLCITSGFLAIFINKNRHEKPHFVSWHGLLGITTVSLVCLQTVMGSGLLYPKITFFNQFKLVTMKKLHALFGALIFILSCFVIFLSFYSNWFVKKVGLYTVTWFTCALCQIFFAATVNNQVAQVYLYRSS